MKQTDRNRAPARTSPNLRRRAVALAALKAAAVERGEILRGSEQEAVVDLLADLRHYCDGMGLSFYLCDQTAAGHFEAETGKEADLGN